MASGIKVKGHRKRKRHRPKLPRAGPIFQSDHQAARDRREALNFTGHKRRGWKKQILHKCFSAIATV